MIGALGANVLIPVAVGVTTAHAQCRHFRVLAVRHVRCCSSRTSSVMTSNVRWTANLVPGTSGVGARPRAAEVRERARVKSNVQLYTLVNLVMQLTRKARAGKSPAQSTASQAIGTIGRLAQRHALAALASAPVQLLPRQHGKVRHVVARMKSPGATAANAPSSAKCATGADGMCAQRHVVAA